MGSPKDQQAAQSTRYQSRLNKNDIALKIAIKDQRESPITSFSFTGRHLTRDNQSSLGEKKHQNKKPNLGSANTSLDAGKKL